MEVVNDQTRLTTATKVEVKNKLNKNLKTEFGDRWKDLKFWSNLELDAGRGRRARKVFLFSHGTRLPTCQVHENISLVEVKKCDALHNNTLKFALHNNTYFEVNKCAYTRILL
uniref:Uncharacterized protein n=1 Tax=Cacopsylla melanoneura TaxID=428564 RepID=A0A8D8LXN5_9HEMI